MTASALPARHSTDHADVVVVGTGFSGLAMAIALKRAGRDDLLVLERAGEVGGTWRDNTYPGCACDVPSHLYSLSHAPNPEWSSTFSPQPEIQGYLRRLAEREGVLEHTRFHCEVEDASWDAAAGRWRLRTSAGEASARVLVLAAGALNEPSIPEVPGLREFEGTLFHSAAWDHDHDLTGERVAVVGTGASAIQFLPEIQPLARRIHLFQRTPPWVMPRWDRRMTRAERALYRRFPALQQAMRLALRWGREAYALPMLHAPLARVVRLAAEHHLRRQVPDPALRERLRPDYAPGCKRILLSNDYLPALGRPNVEVLATGVAEVRGRTVVGADGSEREVDTIILGTGFHVTDFPAARRVSGADGRSLAEHWAGGMQAYKGATVPGFPNLFILLGPNTGIGHTSALLMAEAQVGYVMRALAAMDARGATAVETRPAALAAWNEGVQRRMRRTVWTRGGCSSWYLDEHGRNTTLWPDFTPRFEAALRRFDPAAHDFLTAARREHLRAAA